MLKIPTRILLVDDDKAFVEMLSERLKAFGEVVAPAYSGRQCLDILSEKLIDVVLMDVGMPGMDGIDTLREIKRRFPLVEVILLTGHATTETALEGMRLGAFDYLLKPPEFKELMDKISEARKRKENHEDRIRRAELKLMLRKIGDV